ncbi:MAG: cytosine permease [Pirellulales bacterium]
MAQGEICELTADVSRSPYFSADMAPVGRQERKWGLRDIAVLWISMSACIPTYMLASSLIELGMDWRQAVGTIFLGNVIVLVPMILNAHAGTHTVFRSPCIAVRPTDCAAPTSPHSCALSWPAAGSAFKVGSAAWRSTPCSASGFQACTNLQRSPHSATSTSDNSAAFSSSGR